jgi:retron-type reverse transcriptase
MKRYGNIYPKIYDMDNLRLAHKNAKKDKKFYREVVMVDSNEDYYLNLIHHMLKNKTYKVSEYKISVINDNGKERKLCKLPYFPDRIIQWAILLQIEFIFMEVFTSFTCASLKRRGIHKASRLLDSYMKDLPGTQYCLKIDVKKFYDNIDHEILKQLLSKKIKDKQLMTLLCKIIDSIPGGVGVPIGSYLSQFLANYYLAYFDHWLKEVVKVRYVIRYMDDVVILHSSKLFLHETLREIKKYLKMHLKLELKGNYQIFPTAIRGVDFVGYRHFYGFKLLRKTTAKNFKRKMLDIAKTKALTDSDRCSIHSYAGWLNWCDSFRLQQKYIIWEGI